MTENSAPQPAPMSSVISALTYKKVLMTEDRIASASVASPCSAWTPRRPEQLKPSAGRRRLPFVLLALNWIGRARQNFIKANNSIGLVSAPYSRRQWMG